MIKWLKENPLGFLDRIGLNTKIYKTYRIT